MERELGDRLKLYEEQNDNMRAQISRLSKEESNLRVDLLQKEIKKLNEELME